eukprot:3727580-Alexandrium_andersonii.AAC.1
MKCEAGVVVIMRRWMDGADEYRKDVGYRGGPASASRPDPLWQRLGHEHQDRAAAGQVHEVGAGQQHEGPAGRSRGGPCAGGHGRPVLGGRREAQVVRRPGG